MRQQLQLEGLTKKERKNAASMDFIERIIRVEQRVSSSLGRHVSYNETEYFKSLSDKEKKNFEAYLKRKRNKRAVFLFLVFLSLSAILFFNSRFTGNVISENDSGNVSMLFVYFVVALLFIFVFSEAIRKKREKSFNGYLEFVGNSVKRGSKVYK